MERMPRSLRSRADRWVQVLVHGFLERHFLFDAVEARVEHDGEGQVGVARGVGVAQFQARGVFLARVVHRHADERGAVAHGPGDVAGRFVARHQALVAVHPLVEHGAHFPGVVQLPGDVVAGVRGQVMLVACVEECVVAAAEQGLVHVHAVAGHSEQRLGHESGVQAVAPRDFF